MAVIKCSICKKPVAKRSQAFKRRMSLLREHRKKYHPKEWGKSITKSLKARTQR